MIGSNLKVGGGGERSLINYISNVPDNLKDRLEITVIQTDLYDRERISEKEIKLAFHGANINIVTLKKYDIFRMKLSSANFPDIFSRTIWYLFRYPLNFRSILKIHNETRRADIIYLLHNHFSSFIPKGPVVVGSLHEWIPSADSSLVRFLIRKRIVWSRIDCFHCYTPLFKNRIPLGKFENFYIPSGINPFNLMEPQEERRSDKLMRLLYVGRLNPCKGIKLILDAFSSLENKEKYELHIVGIGELENLFKSKMDKVSYHGLLGEDELQRIYSICNIFIFPSTCDNFGLVVLEALYAGNYAVVDESLRGAFDEFETLGVLRYSRHNEKEIKRNIYELSNKYYRTELFEKVRDIILLKYTWKNVSEMFFYKLIELGIKNGRN